MQKFKILFVFGTRPEAIKLSPLIHETRNHHSKLDVKICVTGQHRAMLDQTLELFEIKTDFDLNIMKPAQDLSYVTATILLRFQEIIDEWIPDLVVVHGDTATTFATSLACFYNDIELAHIEAGLRTYDLKSPFPEEFNRLVVSKLADLHFAPTKSNKENLLKEDVNKENIFVTGNTVIDALNWVVNKIERDSELESKILQKITVNLDFNIKNTQFVLITGHRRENFGDGFYRICMAIRKIACDFPDYKFVYPVHLNPSVRTTVLNLLSDIANVYLIEPLEYDTFVYLLANCKFVLTDSGGIQEEAPSLNKPVLVLRETTERVEALEFGTVELVGTDIEKIYNAAKRLILDHDYYNLVASRTNPYGDGSASFTILQEIFRTKGLT